MSDRRSPKNAITSRTAHTHPARMRCGVIILLKKPTGCTPCRTTVLRPARHCSFSAQRCTGTAAPLFSTRLTLVATTATTSQPPGAGLARTPDPVGAQLRGIGSCTLVSPPARTVTWAPGGNGNVLSIRTPWTSPTWAPGGNGLGFIRAPWTSTHARWPCTTTKTERFGVACFRILPLTCMHLHGACGCT